MSAVEDLGDLIDALAPGGGVVGGGPHVDVPQPGPGGDLVNGHACLGQVCGPVGAGRARVRDPLGTPAARQ